VKIKSWKTAQTNTELCKKLASQLELPQITAEILVSRGYDSIQAISSFISQSTPLNSAFELIDMDKAVERIQRAIHKEEKIVIFGDYDCDGISSTVLLYSYLETVGADVSYYIPDRESEGYGMNCDAVKNLKKYGAELIITVDNGISALQEIDLANSLGIDVVVTDHHKPRETLPNALAVVNPHRQDCPSKFKSLAGVGVVFKLISAMENDDCYAVLEQYADIIALGTIADVVPLEGENRTIVKYGLEKLADTQNAGILELLNVSGLKDRQLNAQSVAFGLVPRINAAGRMGKVDAAVELLLAEDCETAAELAKQLDALNTRRKELEAVITKDISQKIALNPRLVNERVIIISGENWHHGIVGIVAARISEAYGRPCMLFCIENGEARGSCRSIEGFSIIDAISRCGSLLTRFGGHSQAAGLTLPAERLQEFEEMFLKQTQQICPVMPVSSINIDAEITVQSLTVSIISSLSLLEPFGAGNEQPVFLMRNVKIEAIQPIADGKHLRLKLSSGGQCFFAALFGVSAEEFSFCQGDLTDIAANVEINCCNNEQRVSVKVKDIRPAGFDEQSYFNELRLYDAITGGNYDAASIASVDLKLVPDRDDIALVYKYIRENQSKILNEEILYMRLFKKLSYIKLRLCIDILFELKLVFSEKKAAQTTIKIVENAEKTSIEKSSILQKLNCRH